MARLTDAIRLCGIAFALAAPFAASAITSIERHDAPRQSAAAQLGDDAVDADDAAPGSGLWMLAAAGVAIIGLNIRRRRRGPVVTS